MQKSAAKLLTAPPHSLGSTTSRPFLFFPVCCASSLLILALVSLAPLMSMAASEGSSGPLPVCSHDRTALSQELLERQIEAQVTNMADAQKTLYGVYLPEIRAEIRKMNMEDRELLGPNLLHWLAKENFQNGLDLQVRPHDSLSNQEVADLIDFEISWQSLLGYVLTLSPSSFEEAPPVKYFNEDVPQIIAVDTNRYLVFLVHGAIKLTELMRTSQNLMDLLKLRQADSCLFAPSLGQAGACVPEGC